MNKKQKYLIAWLTLRLVENWGTRDWLKKNWWISNCCTTTCPKHLTKIKFLTINGLQSIAAHLASTENPPRFCTRVHGYSNTPNSALQALLTSAVALWQQSISCTYVQLVGGSLKLTVLCWYLNFVRQKVHITFDMSTELPGVFLWNELFRILVIILFYFMSLLSITAASGGRKLLQWLD